MYYIYYVQLTFDLIEMNLGYMGYMVITEKFWYEI